MISHVSMSFVAQEQFKIPKLKVEERKKRERDMGEFRSLATSAYCNRSNLSFMFLCVQLRPTRIATE